MSEGAIFKEFVLEGGEGAIDVVQCQINRVGIHVDRVESEDPECGIIGVVWKWITMPEGLEVEIDLSISVIGKFRTFNTILQDSLSWRSNRQGRRRRKCRSLVYLYDG